MHTFKKGSPFARTQVWKRIGEETTFLTWIKMKNYTNIQVAEMVGATKRSVQYWAAGQSMPSLLMAFKIEQVTKGKVPVASWLGTALAKAKWADPGASWAHEETEEP